MPYWRLCRTTAATEKTGESESHLISSSSKKKIFKSLLIIDIFFSTKSDRDPQSVQLNLSGFVSLTPEQGGSVKHEDSNSLAETKTAGDICHTRVFVLKIHQELLLICTYSLIILLFIWVGVGIVKKAKKEKGMQMDVRRQNLWQASRGGSWSTTWNWKGTNSCWFDFRLNNFLRCFPQLCLCLPPSQGWLQDRSGNWVKDENVEFDSDDEDPPSLLAEAAGHWVLPAVRKPRFYLYYSDTSMELMESSHQHVGDFHLTE